MNLGLKEIYLIIYKNILFSAQSMKNEEIKHYLDSYSFEYTKHDPDTSLKIISKSLQEGKVIGLFHSKNGIRP